MRSSMESGFEIKDVKGRRSIRDRSEEVSFSGLPNRLKNNNEDRSNSEPPRSSGPYLPPTSSRLKPIRESKNRENNAQGSSDEDEELSKSNSQLNESDFDLEIPDSVSASVSQTPTPTPLAGINARRINSETNLNDSKRRLSGFMGNRSKRFCASTSELSFSSHLDTHKSLFSPKNNALSRQSFNSSLYGSNMSLSSTNSRLFMTNSPFYSGKTMFGGASAYPKRDINLHKILRTPVQMRPSSSLSNSSNTSAKSDNMMPESNAAKRILEIMNQFSGPLKEARSMGNNINSIIKIPSLVQNRKRYGEDELNLDRSIALSSPTLPYGRPLSGTSSKNRTESPPPSSSITKPLQIPTMSQLLQMKRLQNNTERVREIASRSDSFLNQNHEYKLPTLNEEAQNNSTGSSSSSLKMKSNFTKNLLRNDRSSINDQLPALPVNLPNIQMPALKSIPQFDIRLPISSVPDGSSTKTSLAKPATSFIPTPAVQFNFRSAPTTSLKNNVKSITMPKSDFDLSKPLPVGDGTVDISSLNHVSQKFSFGKPLAIDMEVDKEHVKIVAKSPIKTPAASDNLFKNLVAQQKSSSWECDSCLTRNDWENTKCLCCDTTKPGSGMNSQTAVRASLSAPPADDLFKNLAAQQKKTQWECESCMTKNDASKDKCACCETPKPGSKSSTSSSLAPAATFTFGMPAASQPTPKSDNLFKTLAAQQKKTQWECDSCMTQNPSDKDVCACCETAKPGTSKPAVSGTPSFSFGMNAAANSSPIKSFSFGMPSSTKSKPVADEGFRKLAEKQSASWECSSCLTRNDTSKSKCVCCEMAKPGSSGPSPSFSFGSKLTSSVSLPAPSEVKFSFGMPAGKSDLPVESKTEESSAPQEKKDEIDKPTFSFGMNHNAPSKPNTTKLPEASVAPTFTFKAPAVSLAPTTASFILKSPEAPQEEKEEMKSSAPPAMFSFGTAKTTSQEPAKPVFGSEVKVMETIKTATEPAKPEEVKKPDFGGFKFGEKAEAPAAVQAPLPAFGSSLNKNGGFSFGKSANLLPSAEPVKTSELTLPSVPSGGFTFGSSNSMTFGNSAATTTSSAAETSGTFVFGSKKTESEAPQPFGSFGAASATQVNSTFGAPQTAPAVFGQPAAGGFNFSANKEDPAPPAHKQSIFAFGAKTAASGAPMLFGNNQSAPVQPSLTPVFGANSTSPFGSNPSSNNNNNESGFGSKMPSFGNVNQNQKRTFEFSSAAPEMPQTKKFDFGGHQQQQQQQQASVTPYQFNAQSSDNKPAFNFSTASTPSFNFTNASANNQQEQQNLFQFGANNSNSNQGIFAFTPSSAPVMQFGSGAAAPTIAIPGITTFSAPGSGSSAAANQRKILRASRRTMTRR